MAHVRVIQESWIGMGDPWFGFGCIQGLDFTQPEAELSELCIEQALGFRLLGVCSVAS